MGKFPRKKTGYIIEDTGEIDEEQLFDTEQEARDSITVTQVERWQCVECEELYEDRDDAYHCCE